MKKTVIFPILLANLFFGQVGIGTAHPRGALDINKGDGSNTSGLVLPANSDVNNILNPLGGNVVPGTMIYDSTNDCVRYFKQTNAWSNCLSTTTEPLVPVPSPDLTNSCTGWLIPPFVAEGTSITGNVNGKSVTATFSNYSVVTTFVSSGNYCNVIWGNNTRRGIGNAVNMGSITLKFDRPVSNIKVKQMGGVNMHHRYTFRLNGAPVLATFTPSPSNSCLSNYVFDQGNQLVRSVSTSGNDHVLYNIGDVWFDEITINANTVSEFCIGDAL